MPSAPAPVTPAPAPMAAAAPAPVTPAPAPMAASAPAHFFGLEMIDFIPRCDGGMGIGVGGEPAILIERLRHQRCGLRARGKGGRAGGKSKGEFQKVPAFHDISSFARDLLGKEVLLQLDERVLNRAFRFEISRRGF